MGGLVTFWLGWLGSIHWTATRATSAARDHRTSDCEEGCLSPQDAGRRRHIVLPARPRPPQQRRHPRDRRRRDALRDQRLPRPDHRCKCARSSRPGSPPWDWTSRMRICASDARLAPHMKGACLAPTLTPPPLPLAAKAPACAHTTRCAAVASRRWRRGASCGQTSLTRVRAARHACRMRRACACVTPHAHTRASGAAPPRAGTVSASYTLSVANCSVGITPVEARRLALEANTTDQIAPFQVCAPPPPA